MTLTLDPHQAAAVPWLLERPRAMLAWEMGVGKTAPLIRAWHATERRGPLLVMCLASARENWRREIMRTVDPAWPPHVQLIVDGTIPLDLGADAVICNYDKIINTNVMVRLRSRRWGALVLDEAHALKTLDAKRTTEIYGGATGKGSKIKTPLVAHAEQVWLATGTPMPNHPGELYSHAAALWPERLQYAGHTMAQWEFEAAFCETVETKYGPKVVGGRNLAELRERLSPVIHVLKRADVLDLPPCRIVSWPLDAEDGNNYVFKRLPDLPELLGTLAQRYGTPDKIETFDLSTLNAYLACIASQAAQLATIRRETSVLKSIIVGLMVAEELDCGAPKSVIFAHHREAIATLTKILARHKPAVIHGDVPPGKRQSEIDRFQEKPDCRVFIGQITAAGSSINLQAASNVIFVEASWTPGENAQALSRVYRRGQLNSVWVRFAFLGGTIDEPVQRANARKAAMIAQVGL